MGSCMVRGMGQAQAPQVVQRSKTEQRIALVISTLKGAKAPQTYEDLSANTGTAYDVLLYIMGALVEVGMVHRIEEAGGPGRPKVRFSWAGAQVMGT